MKVSIIVPVFNAEKYLKECIESLIHQSYMNLEIILVNDGSTDKSDEICMNYAKKDSRIHYINKKNSGVSDTRNVGIDASTGDIITFVDSDDWLDLNTVELCVQEMQKQNVDVLRYNVWKYDKKGNRFEDRLFELKNRRYEEDEIRDVFPRFYSDKNTIGCYIWLLFIKRDFVKKFNTNLTFMEDAIYYYEMLKDIHSIYFFDRCFYHYRYNDASITKKGGNGIKNVYRILKIIDVVEENQYFIQNIDGFYNNLFMISIDKLTLFIREQKDTKKGIRMILEDDQYLHLLDKVQTNRLSKVKRIEYFLLKNKYISLFILIERFRLFLKK